MPKLVDGLGRLLAGPADKMMQFLHSSVSGLGTLKLQVSDVIPEENPGPKLRRKYHEAFVWILLNDNFGLINFVRPASESTIRAIAELHRQEAAGAKVSDAQWALLRDEAETTVNQHVDDAMKAPIKNIIAAATGKTTGSALKTAIDALVMLILSVTSQGAESGAASLISAFVPGVLKQLVYKAVLSNLRKIMH